MALTLNRDNVLARFGGYRQGATSLIRSAGSALRNELNPAVRTGVVSLSAFGFGVLQGKYQKVGGATWGSLPIDLLAGAVFHTAALFGFARNYSPLLHALGDGALATFLTISGYKVGQRWGEGQSLLTSVKGAFVGEDKPVSGGSSMVDEQLSKLARG
jgi:hypothetical protein